MNNSVNLFVAFQGKTTIGSGSGVGPLSHCMRQNESNKKRKIFLHWVNFQTSWTPRTQTRMRSCDSFKHSLIHIDFIMSSSLTEVVHSASYSLQARKQHEGTRTRRVVSLHLLSWVCVCVCVISLHDGLRMSSLYVFSHVLLHVRFKETERRTGSESNPGHCSKDFGLVTWAACSTRSPTGAPRGPDSPSRLF